MNILFIGCVKSSEILLKALVNSGFNIVGVITKNISNYNSDFCNLGEFCEGVGIDYFYSDNINDKNVLNYIKQKKPDIAYCFGWSQLLKAEVISVPSMGIVGFHPTPLPNNRGRHPIIWTLVLGLERTASTFFMINNEADSGDIVSQRDVKVYKDDDAQVLYNRIMDIAKQQVLILTNDFINGTVDYKKQINKNSNNWRERGRKDGMIDFRMGARSIYNLVRALTRPYVGAHFEYNGEDYKVWKCSVVEDKNREFENLEPGKVIEVFNENSFLVKAGEDLVKILKCQNITLSRGDYL